MNVSQSHSSFSLSLLYFCELFIKRIVDSVDVNNWHLSRILLSCATLFPFFFQRLATLLHILLFDMLKSHRINQHRFYITIYCIHWPRVAVAGLVFFLLLFFFREMIYNDKEAGLESVDRNSIQLASRKSCHFRTKTTPKRRKRENVRRSNETLLLLLLSSSHGLIAFCESNYTSVISSPRARIFYQWNRIDKIVQ